MLASLQTQLTDYYAAAFPADMQVQISDLTQLTSGFASDVYRFTLGYSVNGATQREHFVLKCYTDDVEGMDKALKERHALERLSAAGYPVPRASLVETDSAHLGRPFLVMEHIQGRLLWDAMEAASESERRALTEQFAGLLADLHAMSSTVLVTNLRLRDEYTLIKREIYNLRAMVAPTGYPVFMEVVDWLHERMQPCERPCVTHRDFHPWNILLTEDGDPVVVDWVWQISDPRFDVAWTLTLLKRSGQSAIAADMLAEYERRAGHKVEQLAYFEVLASVRWLLTVLGSLKTGANLRNGARASFQAFLVVPATHAVKLIEERTGISLPPVSDLLR